MLTDVIRAWLDEVQGGWKRRDALLADCNGRPERLDAWFVEALTVLMRALRGPSVKQTINAGEDILGISDGTRKLLLEAAANAEPQSPERKAQLYWALLGTTRAHITDTRAA